MTLKGAVWVVALIMLTAMPIDARADEAAAQSRFAPGDLGHDIAAAIRNGAADAASRRLSARDTRLIIQESIQAAIIQSGADPEAVLLALSSLPRDVTGLSEAKAAIAAVRAQVVRLDAQSKEIGNPNATAPLEGGTAPILSAPPPAAGNGSGGGSDYRPG